MCLLGERIETLWPTDYRLKYSGKVIKRKWLVILIPALLLAAPFSLRFFDFNSDADSKVDNYPILTWREMRNFDLKTSQPSAQLQAFDGKEVKIPGYIVPLEDEVGQVIEFLLVPTPMACIHYPPPPPNQIVYVRLKEPYPVTNLYRAVWAKGIFRIKRLEHQYGFAHFEMDGIEMEPYQRIP